MSDLLSYAFMREALLAAVLVGLCAPLVGTFLVQRRMSLIGDGMGHVALAGVAIGVLTGAAPVLTALVLAVFAAVAIELIGPTRAERVVLIAFGLMFGLLAEVIYLVAALTAFSTTQRIVHTLRQLHPQG